MGKICFRLVNIGDAIVSGVGAIAESAKLWEYVPYPMRLFVSVTDFVKSCLLCEVLNLDESFQ